MQYGVWTLSISTLPLGTQRAKRRQSIEDSVFLYPAIAALLYLIVKYFTGWALAFVI